MPVEDGSHLLHTEADVVRAVNVHIIHALNTALKPICPAGISLQHHDFQMAEASDMRQCQLDEAEVLSTRGRPGGGGDVQYTPLPTNARRIAQQL
ncbi:hypothetical protein N7495_007178 [Penicillium taxi]|uniref:uncharacterized protein n=1 Tax=Penicillium taxi TaxID=168475 RepID=UPI0025454A1E|nr:uncharacterized protein N7495_007178 [Penicillium taxi]KAJ5895487.1 hypothetical protein N7495_007178 [Penicillium taxi]